MTLDLTPELVARCEGIEASVYFDMAQAAPPSFAQAAGLEARAFGAAMTLALKAAPAVLFNRAWALGVREPLTTAALEEVVAHLRAAGSANFSIQANPLVDTPEFAAALRRFGLKRTNTWMKLYRESAPPPAAENVLRVEKASPGQAEQVARITAEAFGTDEALLPWLAALVGRPGWMHYLAFDGEQAVGTAALFVVGAAGYLGFGGTLTAHRGRGAQTALIARRIADAETLGCRWLVTETDEDSPAHPNPSYRNLRRAGFALAYTRQNYESQPPPDAVRE